MGDAGRGDVAGVEALDVRTRVAFAKYVLHDTDAAPGRWIPCTCAEADAVWTSQLQVYASNTDMERELCTVWGQPDGRTPVFASIVLMPRGRGCFHVRYQLAGPDLTHDDARSGGAP